MDLERIKQNLRLRSGRRKKVPKLDVPAQSLPTHHGPGEVLDTLSRQLAETGVPPSKPLPRSQPRQFNLESDSIKVQRHPEILYGATKSTSSRSTHTTYMPPGGSPNARVPERISGFGAAKRIPPVLRTTTSGQSSSSTPDVTGAPDFDLRPLCRRPKTLSIERLAELLFSPGHLNMLLHNFEHLAQITSFLIKHTPEYYSVLLRYLQMQKAIKAVQYANAVAEGLEPDDESDPKDHVFYINAAAQVDTNFRESSNLAFGTLLEDVLPMFITYNMVKKATECLVNKITGRQLPTIKNLVGGLSEAFCISDPNQEDNPLIFVSDEFYRLTGYGEDDVIGNNCRFLQGAKTKSKSITRLKESIKDGKEICETILNYRRDGKPFINLLMVAPLHDDRGRLKYLIGAQVDVTGLIERGYGLDGFQHFLLSRQFRGEESRATNGTQILNEEKSPKSKALARLRELSQMFDLEESVVVRSHSRSSSSMRDGDECSICSGGSARRIFGVSDSPSDHESEGDHEGENAWNLGYYGPNGPSGRLPGVYDSYLLIRAAPSLSIIFASPKLRLRMGNFLQHHFLAHIEAPSTTLTGLRESLYSGAPFSAKANFLTRPGASNNGTSMRGEVPSENTGDSRACWISATPLLGGDDRVGVWMIVVLERAKLPNAKDSTGKFGQSTAKDGVAVSTEDAKSSGKTDIAAGQIFEPKLSFQSQSSPQDNPKEDFGPCQNPAEQAMESTVVTGRSKAEEHPHPIAEGKVVCSSDRIVEPSTTIIAVPGYDYSSERAISREELLEGSSAGVIPKDIPKDAEASEVGRVPDSRMRSQPTGFQGDCEPNVETDGSPSPAQSSMPSSQIPSGWDPEIGSRIVSAIVTQQLSERLSLSGSEVDAARSTSLLAEEDTVQQQSVSPESTTISPPSEPGASALETNTGDDSRMSYLDYLKHPGSRPSGEYGRMPSSGLVPSTYTGNGGRMQGGSSEDDDMMDDLECIRTPYSID